jgi:YYY domain-containing protein
MVVQILGLVAAPIAFTCFSRCRDRGWAYAKALGILFPLHITWLLAHAGVPYSFLLLVFGVVVTAGVSTGIVCLEIAEIRKWIRSGWRRVAAIEVVFLAAILFFGVVRAYNPEIESRFRGYGSEKFMDIMFVNSVHQSETFPPNDAWFAGKTINYYWYGYYICSALSKLSGIPTHVGYNLALVTAFALAATMAFALAWHLSGRWWGGVAAAVALTLLGNPQSFRLYVGWHANRLTGAPYIWDSSRVINPPGHTINEFPYFSFLWGDLHGHVTSLPFTVLVLACGVCIWVRRETPRRVWILAPLITALSYGVAVACNNWDLPAYALVLLLTSLVFFPKRSTFRESLRWAFSAAAQRFLAVVLGIVLILPFFIAFDAPKKSLNWDITQKTPLGEFLLMFGYHAFLLGTFVFWLIFRAIKRDRVWVFALLVILSVLLIPFGYFISSWHTLRFDTSQVFDTGRAFLLTGLLLAALVFVVREIFRIVLPGFLERAAESTIEEETRNEETGDGRRFVALLVFLSLCILLGTEYVAMSDFYGKANERMNTLFKFHFQVWTMLSIAGGWILVRVLSWRRDGRTLFAGPGGAPIVILQLFLSGLAVGALIVFIIWVGAVPAEGTPGSPVWMYQVAGILFAMVMVGLTILDIVRRTGPDASLRRRLQFLWAVPWFVLVLLCLTFTVRATVIKTDRNHPSVAGRVAPTLDGRIWLKKDHPEDLALIRWILENGKTLNDAGDVPFIAEAVGEESYSYLGRISAFTGFPALIGWPNHEGIWRSHDPEVAQRKRDGRRLYTAASLGETNGIMEKYGIDVTILGDLERAEFGGAFLAKKFPPYTREAFASGKSSIRTGWTISEEDLRRTTVHSRPVRTDENPPVSQESLPIGVVVVGKDESAGRFNEPRGVTVGPAGRVYVVDSKNGRIQVFTAEGEFERMIPDPSGSNPKAGLTSDFSGACDVAVDSAGAVYVADTWGTTAAGGYGRVVKYAPDGRFLMEWGSPHGMFGPRGIAVAPNGEIYLSDTGNKRVQVFGPDGRFLFMWGEEGEMQGEFVEPVGIAVRGDTVYVCDTGNHRVQMFSLRGQWKGEFVPYGWDAPRAGVSGVEPHIDVDDTGRIYVTDSTRGRLEIFSPGGDPIQRCYTGLRKPAGVGVGSGVGAVAERESHRVRIFSLP